MRSLLREPRPPYDDDSEEKTPQLPERRRERCRACKGTGRVHIVRDGRDVGRPRRCPACRGTGLIAVEA